MNPRLVKSTMSFLPKPFKVSLLLVLLFPWSHFPGAAQAELTNTGETAWSVGSLHSTARVKSSAGPFIPLPAPGNLGGRIDWGMPNLANFIHCAEDDEFLTRSCDSVLKGPAEKGVTHLSLRYPFGVFSHNMSVSVKVQPALNLAGEWNFPLLPGSNDFACDWNRPRFPEGGLSSFGFSYSIEASRGLSFALALNPWDYRLGIRKEDPLKEKRSSAALGDDAFSKRSSARDSLWFSGYTADMGVLWSINESLTLGAVLRTPFTAEQAQGPKVDFQASMGAAVPVKSDSFMESGRLDMPVSYGVGFAYRFSDNLTVSADIFRTEWQDFVLRDSRGTAYSPISGLTLQESNIDPTHQVWVGGEYWLVNENYTVPLRGGVFYDPVPAQGGQEDFYGLSFGSGISSGRFTFDMAYQYRFGRDVMGTSMEGVYLARDVDEHKFYSSFLIRY